MPARLPRCIHVVHDLPGRLRVRLWWLRNAAGEATPLADHLVQLDGMIEVQCRPLTGSVLCRYDPERLDGERVLQAVRTITGATDVVRPGEDDPAEDADMERLLDAWHSDVGRQAAQTFRTLNHDLIRFTEGRMDLGTLAALAFATAGAAEVVFSGKLPAPPWFNLAWWAFRTFATMEHRTIQHVRG